MDERLSTIVLFGNDIYILMALYLSVCMCLYDFLASTFVTVTYYIMSNIRYGKSLPVAVIL